MPFPSVVRTTGLAAALLIVAASAAADTLTADGATYENVYLNEGRSHVYVFMPDEGTVTSIPKDQVDSLELDPDRTRRAALRARWRVSRDRIAAEPSPVDTTQTPVAPDTVTPLMVPKETRARIPQPLRLPDDEKPLPVRPQRPAPNGDVVTDGYVSAIHVKEAPLGDALRAALRSCNLDYRVVGNMVYVSSPEKLRSEPLEPLVTRIYSPRAMGQGDPLPKVVVMNTAGPQGMAGTVTPRVPGQTPGSTPRR